LRLALLLPLAFMLVAADEVPFEPSSASFANAAACRAELVTRVAGARKAGHVAVEGPYDLATGDVRVHMVQADGAGHQISEHRCLAEKLSSRSWRHSMDGSVAEAPATIESMAAKAEWLKKAPGEKQ
jgi:hypothetical protein